MKKKRLLIRTQLFFFLLFYILFSFKQNSKSFKLGAAGSSPVTDALVRPGLAAWPWQGTRNPFSETTPWRPSSEHGISLKYLNYFNLKCNETFYYFYFYLFKWMFFYSLRIFVLNVLKRFRGAALEVLFQESRAHTSSTRRGSDPEIVFWNSDSHEFESF